MASVILALSTTSIGSERQEAPDILKAMDNLTDEQVVEKIGSRNRTESYEAAKEIMKRGERMIIPLVKNKGDHRPYAWGSLGKHLSGEITFAPTEDEAWNQGRIITVEVASLYLISALYYGDLEFGQSAYLKDKATVEFKKYNTPERVAKAWVAVERWVKDLQQEGIESLRAQKRFPLSGTGYHF